MPDEKKLEQLRAQEYQARLVANRLRREKFATDGEPPAELVAALQEAEKTLAETQAALNAEEQGHDGGLVFDTSRPPKGLLGKETTGLSAKAEVRMEYVPTSIYHLFNAQDYPLVSCSVTNELNKRRRLRITSYIEGYSARAVNTVELAPATPKPYIVTQLPTLFSEKVKHLTELTRATVHVIVEELGSVLPPHEMQPFVERHETSPIWLLARTTAPMKLKDPTTGELKEVHRYLGAFVTPNAPSLMKFLRIAANLHPDKRLEGFQAAGPGVTLQVKALFEALKQEAQITYVNSKIDMHPDDSASAQRVRLPRESLEHQEANCIDGTVLFASLLEAISLSPAIVIVPGHAWLAWETGNGNNNWKYLETTRIAKYSFEDACKKGEDLAKEHAADLTLWPVRELRLKHRIMPME